MGTTLIRPDGSVIEAEDADVPLLLKAGFKQETGETFAARGEADYKREHFEGQKFDTFIEGAASGLTLGLSDVATRGLAPDDLVADQEARAAYNPKTRMAGEIAGALAAAIPTGGESLLAKTPAGILNRGGAMLAEEAGNKVVGRLAEGAFLGAGGAVEHANVTGDPLTIEAVVEGAGIGSLINFGAGALSDKVKGIAKKETEAAQAATTLAQDAEKAALAGKLMKDPPATWGEVVESHTTVQKSLQKQNKRLLAEAEDYAEAIEPDSVRSYLGQYRTAKNEVQARIAETAHGQAVEKGQRAATAAERAYVKDIEKMSAFVSSTKKMPRALKDMQKSIDEVAERMGVKRGLPEASSFEEAVADAAASAERFGERKAYISSVYEQLPYKWKPNTLDDFKTALMDAHQAGKLQLSRADLVSAMDHNLVSASKAGRNGAEFNFVVFDPTKARSSVHPLAGEIAEMNETLSKAMKSRVGGYKVDVNRWTKDPSIAADLERSFSELHGLRDKLRKYNVEVPDLPKIPKRPEAFVSPKIELSDAAALAKASTDIDNSIQAALGHLKGKDGAAAVAELRAARARIHATPGLEDLHLPELPAPAVPPMDFQHVRMPKSIREFAKMKVDNPKLELLAKAAESNPEFAASLERLANDLGVEATGGIRAIHKSLNETLSHTEKVAGSLAETAKGGKGWSLIDLLRKRTKSGVVSAAGRVADTGGAKGAILRSLAGGAVGVAANHIDGGLAGSDMNAALFGATFASAKMGSKTKTRSLVAKLAEGKPAAIAKALKPVTSYLGASFIGDDVDEERDPRKQAVNRIGEILRAQYTARDSMYSTVEPLMGEPGDVAFKVFNHTLNAIGHLAMAVPKDPGVDITPSGSRWTPSHEKVHELAARIEAVKDPHSALLRVISGKGHYAATETLWAVWPAMMSELSSEIAMAAPSLNLSYEQGSMLSQIFRTPMTGLQHQAVVTTLQGLYLPQPNQAQSGGGSSPSSNPVGRPAAVQSPVAGSSVAGLLA